MISTLIFLEEKEAIISIRLPKESNDFSPMIPYPPKIKNLE